MDCAELDAAAMGTYTSDDVTSPVSSTDSSDQLWWILMLIFVTVGVLMAVIGALIWKTSSRSDASSQMQQKAAEPASVAL